MDTATLPGIGHNQPPLDELLRDETQALAQRTAELLAAVPRTVVTDRDSAEKATAFAGMIRSHAAKIEAAREERKRPFLEAGRTVDAHYQALKAPLIGSDPKRLGGAAAEVVAKIDGFRREEQAKADAERRRLEEEARQARERQAAAERAQREAEERARREQEDAERKIREAEAAARAATDREAQEKAARERAEAEAERHAQEAAAAQRRLDAEIASSQAAELERQAAAVKAAPIDSGYGVKAFGRKVCRVEITDLTAAIRHARKLNEAPIREAVQSIYDRQARAGVRDLPGATVTEDTTTTIRKGA